MSIVNLRAFRKQVRAKRRGYRSFLTRLETKPPKKLDKISTSIDKEVWTEIDCLSCANCCKVMTPTFTRRDIRRIAAHLSMTPAAFRDKWLKKSSGDWINKSTPCQFLDTSTNKCGIYEVRPADCAGFPHLPKRKMIDYLHVHKQNLEYCPATFLMVQKMIKVVNDQVKGIHPL